MDQKPQQQQLPPKKPIKPGPAASAVPIVVDTAKAPAPRKRSNTRKEEERRRRRQLLKQAKVAWIESAQRSVVENEAFVNPPSFDHRYIHRSNEIRKKLLLNAAEKWHLEEAGKYEHARRHEWMWRKVRWPLIILKIQGMFDYAEDLNRHNLMLIKEVSELKELLKKNDELKQL